MIYEIDNHSSISSALSTLKTGDTLKLKKGIYNEKIKVITPGITITGEDGVIIQNKDYYNKIGSDNKELLTVRTYTMLIQADNVTLSNLEIVNLSVPNKIYGQAVSLHVNGDNFKCINCRIKGGQDTLLAGPIPFDLTIRYKDLLPKDELNIKKSHQLYDHCYIEGDTDFIFGSGIAFFNECELHSINKGYIAAPSHPSEYEFGYVFYKCNLTSKQGLDNTVYLARPWRDYGNVSFIDCNASSHIIPEGFNNWTKSREQTAKLRIYKTLNYDKLVSFAKIINENDLINYQMEKILSA